MSKKLQEHMSGKVVERDNERFKLLFTNSRPVMPENYSATLSGRSIDALIAEEIARLTT